MIPSNPIPQVCNYGSSASYCTCPSDEQVANGVVPLDSLPAAWWNWMWSKTNTAINCARGAVGDIITEINNVLCNAGVCVSCACTDQLYQAIEQIRQTIGTAAVAGAVKSSSTASEVAINPTTGIMTVNCLGNAASLTTASKVVVGAINELKSTYDTCWSNNTTALSGKAPTSHAASATTYGVGNADCYGHLKISDTYTSVLTACSGVAASQKALACVYAVASAAAAGNISLGNTVAVELAPTASAGTATTAARSDHVHTYPLRMWISNCSGICGFGARWSSAGYTCLFSTNSSGACTDNNVRVSYADSAGTASSATNATNAGNTQNFTWGGNQTAPTGRAVLPYALTGAYENGYPTNYGTVLNLNGNFPAQLLLSHPTGMYYRTMRDVTNDWNAWAQVIDTNNIGSQTVANAHSATLATQVNRYAYTADYNFDLALFDNTNCIYDAWLYVGANCRATFNTATGVLTAACFGGEAACSYKIFTCGYTTNYDFDVKLANSKSDQYQIDWVSACCRLRYCNTTGTLRITNSVGTTTGTICAACFRGTATCAVCASVAGDSCYARAVCISSNRVEYCLRCTGYNSGTQSYTYDLRVRNDIEEATGRDAFFVEALECLSDSSYAAMIGALAGRYVRLPSSSGWVTVSTTIQSGSGSLSKLGYAAAIIGG